MRFHDLEIVGLTALAVDHLLPTGRGPITLLEGGHLAVEVDGAMLVRVAAATLVGDGLRIRRVGDPEDGENPENAEVAGEPGPSPLAIVDGSGSVVFARGRGTFHVVRLRRDRCYLRESAVFAADPALQWEFGALPGSRAVTPGGAPFLRIVGDGRLAWRCLGDLVVVRVAPGQPQRVNGAALLGWIGDVIPLAEPGLPYVRCEGEGALLLDLVGEPR